MPLFFTRKDITKLVCDAIVNTTNREMIGGSGVDLAVHTAAGAELDAECKTLVPLELGFAKLTKGYNLPCKYIIHTRGPVWRGGERGERALLKSCYCECLKLAKTQGFKTIAFPLISSGHYGYPKAQVLSYAVEIIKEFLLENDEMTVFLCVYDKESYEFSVELFNDIAYYILGNCEAPPPPLPSDVQAFQDESVLDCFLEKKSKSFAEVLVEWIDKRGMTDPECYKRANVDKKTFSKIRNNPDYHPSKAIVLALAVSLRLKIKEAEKFLETAGLAFQRSCYFDLIVEYFIRKGIFDVFSINEALWEFGEPLLGSNSKIKSVR